MGAVAGRDRRRIPNLVLRAHTEPDAGAGVGAWIVASST